MALRPVRRMELPPRARLRLLRLEAVQVSARLVLPPDAPRDEWLAARRQGITASVIAVLDWLRRPDPAHENTLRRALHAEGARISKTAAPGASGTADRTAVIYRKDTAMSHDLIEEGTPRGRQIAAALALAHLLESGPDETAEWRIGADGALHGHVRRPHSDADARRAVHEFAGFLGNKGAERSQGRNDHSEWIRLCTSGTYRGVPVNVWTHVGIRTVSPYSSFGGAR
jgi:hypothetical protein